MAYIAFDLGLTFGWFDGESGGSIRVDDKCRAMSFYLETSKIILRDGIDTIIYEDATFQRGKAAYVFNGQKTLLQLISEEFELKFTGYSPIHIKKVFTGSGKAKKENMIDKCIELGHTSIIDSNHADAIATWHTHRYHMEEDNGHR